VQLIASGRDIARPALRQAAAMPSIDESFIIDRALMYDVEAVVLRCLIPVRSGFCKPSLLSQNYSAQISQEYESV
jgi:hypothetical protein